jgi:hypothetical protein
MNLKGESFQGGFSGKQETVLKTDLILPRFQLFKRPFIEISEKVFMNSLEDWVGGVRKPSSGHI